MDIRPGTILDGPGGQPITIEELLGRGGFGQVFRGALADTTKVAVKTVLTATLSPAELRTLQNEAKHAVGLDHPNVVRVLHVDDGDAVPGRPPYIVMEYVDGGALRGVIEDRRSRRAPFSPDQLRAMYLQIANGMEAVNARVVHRDLKPENVLIDATSGRLKIADFGLAKLADAATRTVTFKGWGTPPYMAPEAFEGGPNTVAMDVYAAGVMFYELATMTWPAQPPPGDDGAMAWRKAHLLGVPKDVRTLRPDLPLDLAQLIMKMLHKDAARRPGGWPEVTARLQQGAAPTTTGPDVSALVNRAMTSFLQESETAARAREARERREEREALLVQAFAEPSEILQGLVDAFNGASELARLTMQASGSLGVEVKGHPGRSRLVMQARIIDDLDLRPDGVVRIIAAAQLVPPPKPPDQRAILQDRDSFGGFNLYYRLQSPESRFGTWNQVRFEISPLMREISYPRWFPIGLAELPHELRVLRAMGRHQHQKGPVDDAWFKSLLEQIL